MKKYLPLKEPLAKEFENDLTVVFSLLWIFYLLIYSVGASINFVHVINDAVGFIAGFLFRKE